jgi:hypothetical protein
MNKSVIRMLSLVLLLSTSCFGQKTTVTGKWKEIKVQQLDGKNVTWDGKPEKPRLEYEFLENGECIDYTFRPHFFRHSYFVDGNILSIGKLTFQVEVWNKNQLIIVDYDVEEKKVFGKRHTFKKID